MNRLIGSAGMLLLACHAASAEPASLRTAQADPGTPAGVPAPAGGVGAPAAITPVLPQPGGLPGVAAPVPVVPPTASTTTQAKAPPAPPSLAPSPFSGTRRNDAATPAALQPSLGALPYGGTQSTVGVPNPVAVQPYGGTQRDSVGSLLGDTQVNGGVPTYTGTQSTIGGTQNLGNAGQANALQPGAAQAYGTQPYNTQPYGVQTYGGTQRNGLQGLPPGASTAYTGSIQGNGTVYSRAPLGAVSATRDQTGVFGGTGGYDARGVYTGVAPQPLAYGQIYATTGGVRGGIVGTGVDATGPLRPFIPPNGGPGRPNSGYGLPNGSKPTYMDARGIQRSP